MDPEPFEIPEGHPTAGKVHLLPVCTMPADCAMALRFLVATVFNLLSCNRFVSCLFFVSCFAFSHTGWTLGIHLVFRCRRQKEGVQNPQEAVDCFLFGSPDLGLISFEFSG